MMTKMRMGTMWLMGLLTVAVAVVTMGAFQGGTASTAGDPAIESEAQTGQGGEQISVANLSLMLTVWSATLTVGEESQNGTTVWGYVPDRNLELGNLDDTDFSDRNVEYTIDSLVYKEVGNVRQLVLETSPGLPNDLIFEADGERYPLSDADALGLHGDIHVWWFDSGLGWEDGDAMTVKLLRAVIYNACGVSEASESGVGFRLGEVWSATLMVGEAAGEESDALGYQSGWSEAFGGLDNTTFADRGTKYSVGRLVHRPVGNGHFLLDVETGRPLDPNMVFEVDGERYAVLDSGPVGYEEGTHWWLLDSSLGWSEGDTMTVKVLRFEFYRLGDDEQALAHAGG